MTGVFGEGLSEPHRLAVGVPVQRQVADRLGELLAELLRQWVWRLVRVQSDGNGELRRLIWLEIAEARTGLGPAHGSPGPSSARSSTARA
jgi:hypothetical protein